MKIILLSLFLLSGIASASTTTFLMVKMPVCLVDESTGNSPIIIIDVPVLTSGSTPDINFNHITSVYTPPSAAPWVKPYNVNVAVMYGIQIESVLSGANDSLTITIHATSAKKPKDMEHSIDQVIDAVEKCVRLMEKEILPNHKKVIVRKPVKVGAAMK